jgi:hypothetical protein
MGGGKLLLNYRGDNQKVTGEPTDPESFGRLKAAA